MASKKTKQLSKKSVRMYQKSGQSVEEFFYQYPLTEASIREIALNTGLAKSSVQYQLKILKERGIVSSDGRWVDSWKNCLKKSLFFINRLIDSGVIDYLEQELVASTIILFGSFAKGESAKESDIDIFVECAKDKEILLTKYEKMLGHKIQLFKRHKITQLPKHLLNNVVNGIKLRGYFTIK
ncbi:MAG TPA: nucleotidyltransferase domain-containing protein [Candidatus Nanoarchaeia archaeon]|nr:nucleotidyltransferase domain-containing protein [Candidatus Nanoarchaeia archaeon]